MQYNIDSNFWFKFGGFSISLEIDRVEPKKLSQLQDLFIDNTSPTNNINFGIDEERFFPNKSYKSGFSPNNKKYSVYWFTSDDFYICLRGKYISPGRIKRLFDLMKEDAKENSDLKFGVDWLTFTPDSGYPTISPASSIESFTDDQSVYSYNEDSDDNSSMEIYDNENSMYSDNGNIDSEDNASDVSYALESIEDLSRNNETLAKQAPLIYSPSNQSIEDLYGESYNNSQQTSDNNSNSNTLQQQQLERINQNLIALYNEALVSSGTPEYFNQLIRAVSEIHTIHHTTGFEDCSVELLETYLNFLMQGADICCKTFDNHIENVLNALFKKLEGASLEAD